MQYCTYLSNEIRVSELLLYLLLSHYAIVNIANPQLKYVVTTTLNVHILADIRNLNISLNTFLEPF